MPSCHAYPFAVSWWHPVEAISLKTDPVGIILYILTVKCPKPVVIMLLDPKRLIDRSIADLTQLSALLTAEISDDAALRSPELRACEEAVATIDCLIPRLQVARNARIAPLRSGACPDCDD
jgi:hypothetical protein